MRRVDSGSPYTFQLWVIQAVDWVLVAPFAADPFEELLELR